MSAHQCPRCPLRFSYRTEVEWHLATDHAPRRRLDSADSDAESVAVPADADPRTEDKTTVAAAGRGGP
jgi:hypothetical protein